MLDVLFILLLALVVFGPKKLPEIAAQVGKYLAQFRQAKNEMLDQLGIAMLSVEEERRLKKGPNRGDQPSEPLSGERPGATSG